MSLDTVPFVRTPIEIDPAPLTLKSGVDFSVEDQANQLLAESRRGVTKLSDKKDYFTEEQLLLRQQREVYNQNGVPDKGIVCGLFKRTYNPIIGRRPSSGPKSSDTFDYGGSSPQPEWT